MSDHRLEYTEKVFKKGFNQFVETNREYLEKARKIFLDKASGITYRDGTHYTPEDIWSWLFETTAPEKYPNIFVGIENYDLESPGIVNFLFLYYSFYDHLVELKKRGAVIVSRKETVPDLFFGLGAIPIRGGANAALRNKVQKSAPTNIEACQTGSTERYEDDAVPFTCQVIPTGVHCYDKPNNALSVARMGKAQIPTIFIDNPIESGDTEWAIDYKVKSLRRAAEFIAEKVGQPIDEEAIRQEIKIGNQVRKAIWRIFELQGESDLPPFTSWEFETIIHSGHNWAGEPEAYRDVIEEIARDVPDRINHKVSGFARNKNPVRIFVGGACTHFRPLMRPENGAIPVGVEWFLAPSHGTVEEEGDPFRAIVTGTPVKALQKPLVEHAEWFVEQLKRSRADGFIYGYHWGCNFASSAAHVICDVIKEKVGIPTFIMETEMIGKTADESGGGLTRVDAFVEMLKQRKQIIRKKTGQIARQAQASTAVALSL
jgi:hypothetical protein